ncbi:hypothetical protein FF36_06237 [Frankia torreyi]|uniref:Uncharacterized protein n=1 Tax=Frankia torreyi TaxID=1856 RepID=A0A0D8B5W2_9ACTN|nr:MULTISPECIES: hypothetical protein [unclassified Frankia]KJE19495.1 hypothetical protein FF36_06237 [Frankia torreyi]
MSAVLAEEDRLRAHRYDLADYGLRAEEVNTRLGALIRGRKGCDAPLPLA